MLYCNKKILFEFQDANFNDGIVQCIPQKKITVT